MMTMNNQTIIVHILKNKKNKILIYRNNNTIIKIVRIVTKKKIVKVIKITNLDTI